MKKIQSVPRREVLMGTKWSHHVYGKRHRAFELVRRGDRLKNAVRILVAGAAMMGLFFFVYE